MASKVEAKINGRIYGGWKEVDVTRSLKSLSGSFALSVTDRWSGQNQPWPINRGDNVEILINGETVITGYVDAVTRATGPSERSISVSGRDKTADLVDCSIDNGKAQYNNVSLEAVARELIAPFGLSLKVETSVGARIDTIAIQVGETVFEFLEKLARKRGVLLTTDGRGSLVITRPGTDRAKTGLVLGTNIISATRSDDGTDRFSKYTVKSQPNLGDLIQNNPATEFVVKASAKDAGVKRHRPKVMQAEGNATTADAITRAQWEAKTRAAKGEVAQATVSGWTQGDGSLWKPNQMVKVEAPWLNLNEERLISEVNYRLTSQGGSICVLTLDRKDAYLPEPIVLEASKLGTLIARDLGGR